MKIFPTIVLAIAVVGAPSKASSQTLDSEAVLDSIARYLSKQWGFPYTGFVGSGYVRIGYVYGYEEPQDFCEWQKLQRRGKRVAIGLFDDTIKVERIPAIKTQRYLVKDRLASFVSGSLRAELKEAGIGVEAFRDALKDAEIRFVVHRFSYPEASLLRLLSDLDLSREINLSTKSGFVSPYELLVVTGFSYKADASMHVQGDGGLSWLPVAQASIGKGATKSTESLLDVPDYSVVGFKTVPYPPKKHNCH